jgi:hypothetical protein
MPFFDPLFAALSTARLKPAARASAFLLLSASVTTAAVGVSGMPRQRRHSSWTRHTTSASTEPELPDASTKPNDVATQPRGHGDDVHPTLSPRSTYRTTTPPDCGYRARECYLCSRTDLLPMYPVRTVTYGQRGLLGLRAYGQSFLGGLLGQKTCGHVWSSGPFRPKNTWSRMARGPLGIFVTMGMCLEGLFGLRPRGGISALRAVGGHTPYLKR